VGLLKAEPIGPVRSLDEFFALAYAIESDAAGRYAETAKQLREQGASALADVFDRLEKIQRGHVSELADWAARRGRNALLGARLPWPLPDTFDAPPEEIAKSKLLTPYRALASAVRREERAFAFWTYVAAHAATREVKQAAEQMAMEELEHVSILRRERRQAFHAERSVPGTFETTAGPAALAAEERRLAELIEQDRTAFPDSELTQMIVGASRDAAVKLDKLEARHHPTLSLPRLSADLRNDPLAISELLVEAYLIIADRTKNAKVLKIAQDLAGAAIYRLATLRSHSASGIKART
jgi:rubrerythrin